MIYISLIMFFRNLPRLSPDLPYSCSYPTNKNYDLSSIDQTFRPVGVFL